MKQWKRVFPLLAAAAFLLSGCGAAEEEAQSGSGSAQTLGSETAADLSEMFTDRDREIGYDEETCIRITFDGDSVACESDTVTVSDDAVTITQEGTYLLSGTWDEGMVIVDANDAAKIQIVLDNVSITNSDSAAIYVREADKVFLATASGSVNTLANGGSYTAIDDNNIDAAVFAKSDLTLNGAGTLAITAAAGHGVVSKDDLVLASGTYEITAASHGLSGKDSVRIAGGTYEITSGKDGVHAENADDADLGFVYLANGTFTVTAQGDGFSAGTWMVVEDGSYQVTTGGGSTATTGAASFDRGMQPVPETSEEKTSTKGFKAAESLTLNGGSFTIDAADDALHSNGSLDIVGGTYDVMTSDDGAHADNALTIAGGTICIRRSYEGLEGLSIEISGGSIDITASDDGINAAGGADSSGFGMRGDAFAATEGALISISGGTLHVDAAGDGIDSNGDLRVTGGEIYVAGPTSNADGALDYSGSAEISGGVFLATGTSGMAQNFGSDSTQGSMLVSVQTQTGGSISLTAPSGETLVTWKTDKSFDSVLISCPNLVQGETYRLTAGSAEQEITLTDLVYGSGGMGGVRGGIPEGEEKMPDGRRGGMFEEFEGESPSGGFDGPFGEIPPDAPDMQAHSKAA